MGKRSIKNVRRIFDEIKKTSTSLKDREQNFIFEYASLEWDVDWKNYVGSYSHKSDGGIDFFHSTGKKIFYIVQGKFLTPYEKRGKDRGEDSAAYETDKILDYIDDGKVKGIESRVGFDLFYSNLQKELKNPDSVLKIIYLTTQLGTPSVNKAVEKKIDVFRKKWNIQIEFEFHGYNEWREFVFDKKEGYTPRTGMQKLWISHTGIDRSNVNHNHIDFNINHTRTILAKVKVSHILDWFNSAEEIDTFIQGNIRKYAGLKKTNEKIQKSAIELPDDFIHKHNGVSIFVGRLEKLEKSHNKYEKCIEHVDCRSLVRLSNPQIVNGGQSITTLFNAMKNEKKFSKELEVQVRIILLDNQELDTPELREKQLKIIEGLNSQTAIKWQDLRANNITQRIIENSFKTNIIDSRGKSWEYYRKTGGKKGTTFRQIWNEKLALQYYVIYKESPYYQGMGPGRIFEGEAGEYGEVFNHRLVDSPIKNTDHIMYEYLITHLIFYWLGFLTKAKFKKSHPSLGYSRYLVWYIGLELYNVVKDWTTKVMLKKEKELIGFLASKEFREWVQKQGKSGVKAGQPKKLLTVPQIKKYWSDGDFGLFYRTAGDTKKGDADDLYWEKVGNKRKKEILRELKSAYNEFISS